jgi:pimeloyl-ACP methyl ester carboxylesterase
MAIAGFTGAAGRARFLAAYEEAMAELPAPRATEDVPTSFGTVRAYRFGEPGPAPLVLLPGTRSSTPLWGDNLPSLLRLRPVVTLDALGEPGLSEQSRPITGADDQAAWLAEALAGLGLPAAHLLGASYGGWHAVNLAIRRPERVASLAVLDPANTFGRIGPKALLFSLGALPGAPAAIRRRALRWLSGGAEADEHAVGRLIAVGMRDFRGAVPVPAYPTDAQLRAIAAPCLVVIAGRSIIHNPARAAARARLVPGARVELWPDASHALTGEFPERIAALLASP